MPETAPRPDAPDELLSRFDEEIGEAIADALGEELGNSPRIVELTTAVMADVSPNLAEFQRQVRERVAAEIRRAAAGRRHYAKRATEPGDADDYMGEAAYLEAAAEIAEGSNPLAMCSLLPHELWTDAEHSAHGEAR